VASVIRVSCLECGTVDLSPMQCSAQIIEAINPRENVNLLKYTCPKCQKPVEYRFENSHVHTLLASNVKIQRVKIPVEARELHVGPPISHDDILDLVLALREL
jgi:hypothetical protein